MCNVAIIILNYNTYQDTIRLVGELQHQTVAYELQIVVVDNASLDASYDRLKPLEQEFPNVVILQTGENMGYAKGNNIGLRYASDKGLEYAMIINPDMEISQSDYVARVSAKMDSDCRVAVLGTDIKNVEGNHQNPLREVKFWEELFWFYELLQSKRKKGRLYTQDYTRSGYCEKLSGCCLIIRILFIEQIGFFDENTFLYCEESILAKQAQRMGMKMFYMSDSVASHNHKRSEKGDPVIRMRFFGESRNYYLKTYSGYSRFALWSLRLSRLSQQLLYSLIKKLS